MLVEIRYTSKSSPVGCNEKSTYMFIKMDLSILDNIHPNSNCIDIYF